MERFKPDNPSTEKGRRTKCPTPTKEAIQLVTAGKGKTQFFQWSVTRCINNTPRQASDARVGGQHKIDAMVFLFIFVFFCLIVFF